VLFSSRPAAEPVFLEEVITVPFVNVKVIEGVFSPDQKQEMVRRLTDTMVEIEGENMRPVTWVVVEEVKSGDWGIAGNPLSTADVKALAAGQPVG
jgi:4-oxalocrotonate tautomerase